MAAINWTNVVSGLQSALTLVNELAPLAAAAGPEGALIGGLIGKVAGWANEAVTLAETAQATLASNDLATIKAAAAAITAANDALAANIAGS